MRPIFVFKECRLLLTKVYSLFVIIWPLTVARKSDEPALTADSERARSASRGNYRGEFGSGEAVQEGKFEVVRMQCSEDSRLMVTSQII